MKDVVYRILASPIAHTHLSLPLPPSPNIRLNPLHQPSRTSHRSVESDSRGLRRGTSCRAQPHSRSVSGSESTKSNDNTRSEESRCRYWLVSPRKLREGRYTALQLLDLPRTVAGEDQTSYLQPSWRRR